MGIKASEKTVSEILGYPVQYIIPPYQRPYQWRVGRWKDLWTDLLATQNRVDRGQQYLHFFGPIVTVLSEENAPGVMVTRHFLIDGKAS